MSRPTLADIARMAYVSTATVSRVLNNQDGVNAETRQRVYVAARALGYQRTLDGLVGLIIPDRANPFFADVARGAEDALTEADRVLVVREGEVVHEAAATALDEAAVLDLVMEGNVPA